MNKHQSKPTRSTTGGITGAEPASCAPFTRHFPWRLRFGASLMLASWGLMLSFGAFAQNFAIDWFTFEGGGRAITGGVFAVTGTIGQPDAGKMSGGNFTVDGGFWAIIAPIQTPGAPTLTVLRTPTNTVMVYWPSPSTGFNLQQTANLNTPVWTTPAETVTDNGTIKFIIVNPLLGNRFYRLIK